MTTIAVTGGRDYSNRQRVFEALDEIQGVTMLIHGAARGADTLAAEWARSRGIPLNAYHADWENIDVVPCRIRVRDGRPYNALAGLTRNIEMLVAGQPDLLVVFPGGNGTAHCHREALRRGIPSLEIHDDAVVG